MKKVCGEYFPRATISDWPSCDTCKYNGYISCTNPNVRKRIKTIVIKDGKVLSTKEPI